MLTLSTTSIALGRSNSSSSFALTNSGGTAVDYQLTSTARWLSAAPASGTVEPGATVRIAVRANRGAVAEGQSAGRINATWDTGNGSVAVSLTEEREPNVGRPTAPSPTCEDQTVPVRASVSDESGLRSVTLRWSSPGGSGTRTMTKSGSRWVAQMGPITVGGTVTMKVTATDRRGNTATSTGSVGATPCPG